MNFSLTDTEKEIMYFFWNRGKWTSGAEFWHYFNSIGRTISRQAVNSYLSRMVDKGLLIKYGRKFMYAYTEDEFEEKRASEILDTLYDGSVKKFISAALTGGKKLSSEEANELIDFLNNL